MIIIGICISCNEKVDDIYRCYLCNYGPLCVTCLDIHVDWDECMDVLKRELCCICSVDLEAVESYFTCTICKRDFCEECIVLHKTSCSIGD